MDSDTTNVFQVARNTKLIPCQSLMLMMLMTTNIRHKGWKLRDIVRLSGFSAPTVGMAKRKLVQEGLVEEHLPFRDQRTVKLYLTVAGEKRAAELWASVQALADLGQTHVKLPDGADKA